MCLILFAFDTHPAYRLVLAANRDEYYRRPTEGLHEWTDTPGLLAGRDLEQLGTWMGVTRTGRLAAITNYRDPGSIRPHAPSRGQLVANFLKSTAPASDCMANIAAKGHLYNGFNLIGMRGKDLYYYSNRKGRPERLKPGLYGLSNHLLDTAWPKVERGRKALARLLPPHGKAVEPETILRLLEDQRRPADHQLPDTGMGLEKERMLAPMFITSPDYGTRSSSILLIDRQGHVTFIERVWLPARPSPVPLETRQFSFVIHGC